MKRFFARFEREYAALLASLGNRGDPDERERYAAQMLICLVFVHFLQQKGLLGTQGTNACDGERDYFLTRLELVQQKAGRGHFQTFYRAFLLKLFQQETGVQQERGEFDELLGDVPSLKSDLLTLYELVDDRALSVPDEAFERLLRFLHEFEWCLNERAPRNGKEITPHVMSSLFEKYWKQKQMGAYYTQEDVTAYIGKNSIIPRLFECVIQKCPALFHPDGSIWALLRTDPERYVYSAVKHGCGLPLPPEIEIGISDVERREAWDRFAHEAYALPMETWREVVARRQRFEQIKTYLASGKMSSIDELITYNLDVSQFARDVVLSAGRIELVAAFYESLEKLTILDPTCGSGAFLLAALAILEPLYETCLERMQQMVNEHEQDDGRSGNEREQFVWRACSAWLKQTTHSTNRRAFIARAISVNNLYGVDIMREATEICKLRLFLQLVSRIETSAEMESLSAMHFNIRVGNALVGFATRREITSLVERDPDGLPFARLMLQEQEVERLFADIQQFQSAQEVQIEQLASVQRRLRALSLAWCVSLDHYLATSYDIDAPTIRREEERAEAFARWRAAFQPFHWMAEWYGVLRNGGFDVIIGNPPYVAYSKVRGMYQVQFYETQTCGNLCAYVLERAVALLCPYGRCGIIVPVSTIASKRYRPLIRLLLERQVWISSYSNRPGQLFADVEQRLAILLVRNVKTRMVLASAYRHWYDAERTHLFATLSYTAASIWEPTGMPVKSGSRIVEAIFARLVQHHGFPLLNSEQPGAAVWVHNGPTYWVRALPFEPNAGRPKKRSEHYCKLVVETQETAFALAAILNSSTFYFFYKLVSNCRDLGQKELQFFPLGQLQPASEARLVHLGRLLAQCLRDSAERHTRHYTRTEQAYASDYEEYYPARARELLDQIDRILAEHYGFSDEELDFLLHYDSKYRQSRKAARKVTS